MRLTKWAGFFATVLLAVSCFMPWVIITSKNIVVSGVEAAGTNFGKPGYVHFVLCFLFLVFHFVPKVWAKRWNMLVVALNIAWAVRNFIIISMCRDGECPEKQTGLYLVIFSAIIMLVAALFPDIKLKDGNKK